MTSERTVSDQHDGFGAISPDSASHVLSSSLNNERTNDIYASTWKIPKSSPYRKREVTFAASVSGEHVLAFPVEVVFLSVKSTEMRVPGYSTLTNARQVVAAPRAVNARTVRNISLAKALVHHARECYHITIPRIRSIAVLRSCRIRRCERRSIGSPVRILCHPAPCLPDRSSRRRI